MSSQSHSLTTETEPDAEKGAYIVYHLGDSVISHDLQANS